MLEINETWKTFNAGTVNEKQAPRGVSLTLNEGDFCTVIGGNGAGKSTMLNAVAGTWAVDAGTISIGGTDVTHLPEHRRAAFIGRVFQDPMMGTAPTMQIVENLALAARRGQKRGLRWGLTKTEKDRYQEMLSGLGLGLEDRLTSKVGLLSGGQRQALTLLMASLKKPKLLLLDEPTAVLGDEDAGKLIKVLKELAKKGTSVLFCSHRLHEICQVCDHVTVLRDGQVISDYTKDELDMHTLARDMIGYDVAAVKKEHLNREKKEILKFQDFSVYMPGEYLDGLSLDVYQGEILGLTSLSGHGKLAVGYGVMGQFPVRGELLHGSAAMEVKNVRRTIEQGIFLLPDDRKNMGLLLEHSVRDNIIFSGFYGRNLFQKKMGGIFPVKDKKEIERYVEEQIEKLEIKCESAEQKVKELSGGNQQKVCIARAVLVAPKVLFVMEPTRGVDIGAKEKILDMLVQINREQGTTIVVASSELEELKRISDRIAVFCEGKLSQILPPDAPDEEFAFAFTGEEEEDGQ